MKTIATINFKGGVGKTTVTWCLGDVLSTHSNYNVLLFDLDAQASLTQSIEFGQQNKEFTLWKENSEKKGNTIHAALKEFLGQPGKFKFQPDENFIYQVKDRYHFVPAMDDLYWVGLDAFEPEKGRVFIRRILEKIANSSDLPKYDYIIFDCPPSFTPLSYSVLTCCDLVLIPINPDFFAVKGVDLLVKGLQNKIESHPFPEIAVFANRVPTSWKNSGLEPTLEASYRISEIKEVCKIANDVPNVNVRFLNAYLLQRVAIGRAITRRRTPSEHVGEFMKLWKESGGKL